jgi:putative SOS response-associated peptidase YedK
MVSQEQIESVRGRIYALSEELQTLDVGVTDAKYKISPLHKRLEVFLDFLSEKEKKLKEDSMVEEKKELLKSIKDASVDELRDIIAKLKKE